MTFVLVSYGVVSAGALKDGEGAVFVGDEPDPAGAEEGGAFCFKFGFEGVETTPLFLDLSLEMPDRSRA